MECIGCDAKWTKPVPVEKDPGDVTSSLCGRCFHEAITPVIRRRQRKEGNFDCFGTAGNHCDQDGCKYRRHCLHPHQ